MSWKPKNPFPLEVISLRNSVTITNTGRVEAGPQRRLEPGTRVPGNLLCLRACPPSGSRESCTSQPGWLFSSASREEEGSGLWAVGWGLGRTECLGGWGPCTWSDGGLSCSIQTVGPQSLCGSINRFTGVAQDHLKALIFTLRFPTAAGLQP